MDKKCCWLRFQRAFGYGTTRGQKILLRFGHPEAIFSLSQKELGETRIFTQAELRRIREATEEEALRVLDFCEDDGCGVLTPDEEEYPKRLKEIYGYPAALFVRGRLGNLDEELCIGMVGTRRSTPYGKRAAETISGELAAKGAVIVSGLARGIDTASHTAALKAGGKTVAVLGCGIDIVYPPENARLEELIVRYGGAVVTEFQPGEQPLPYHFPIRNRIISGLCSGIVVVEGTRRSGSLITAGHAFSQNRDVFAVPGSIFSRVSEGPNYLLSQGAKAVTGVESILEEYRPLLTWEEPKRKEEPVQESLFEDFPKNGYNGEQRIQREPKTGEGAPGKQAVQRTLPNFLNETQQKVFDALSDGAVKSSDEIAGQCGLPVSAVLSALTQLEIFGLAAAHPGRRFSAV